MPAPKPLLDVFAAPRVPSGIPTAVVIDVLRATTTLLAALEAGADGVVPCASLEQARKLRAADPHGTFLCGEREGLPPAGFDAGNSPGDMTTERVRGKRVVITTTNGTAALEAVGESQRIATACFVNRAATAAWLAGTETGDVALVCAGRRGGSGADDELFAAALLAHPAIVGAFDLGPRARALRALWKPGLEDPRELLGALLATEAGGWLAGLGFERDVRDAAQLDRSATVPRAVPEVVGGARSIVLRAG